MISGTSSKTRVYSSSLRYLHLLYETFYFSWKKSREKQIIIILEHMEYGLGKPPIQQHSQNEGLKGFPDPKNVSYPEKVTVSEWGGGWNLRNMVDFVNFLASFFRNADTSPSMFHPLVGMVLIDTRINLASQKALVNPGGIPEQLV